MTDLTQDEAVDRARTIAVESYDIFVDLTAEPVLSRTEIRFCWLRPDASTFAELRPLAVRSATLNGVSLPAPQDGRLRLSRAGDGDQAVLVVEAEAGYSSEGRGLSRLTDRADAAGYVLAFSYPDCGPELFCCFDQQDLTATYRLAVRVPDGWECVANGQLDRRDGDVWAFTPVNGMRPYDLTFCAGPFPAAERTQAGETEVTVRHRRSLLGQTAVAALPRFAGYARDAVAYYTDLLGVPCPYPGYDIVFLPELPAMAISTPGLMVVNEVLLGRDADAEHSAMVCAHEVAHLWFGALVGPRWWDDMWLDEALASYLSYAALAAIAGVSEAESWTRFAYTDKLLAYEADALPSRQPISSPVAVAADSGNKPYGILYAKGASVIRALAALIGENALQRGLHDYLTRFAHRSAALDDLVGCWSRASGQDLAGWAGQWLRTAGTPTVTLNADGPEGSTVIQDRPGRQRIGIGLYDLDGDGRLRRRDLVRAELEAERTAVAGLAGADAVLLNEQDLAHTRTRFDDRSARVLAAAACQVGDPLSEAVGWNGFWLQVTQGEWPAARFTDMVARRLQAGGLPAVAVETCSAAPSRPPTRGLRRASGRSCASSSPGRPGPRPGTRASSPPASPTARRVTTSWPSSRPGWPGKTSRTGSSSTPAYGRGSWARWRPAGGRGQPTSTRWRNSTPSWGRRTARLAWPADPTRRRRKLPGLRPCPPTSRPGPCWPVPRASGCRARRS